MRSEFSIHVKHIYLIHTVLQCSLNQWWKKYLFFSVCVYVYRSLKAKRDAYVSRLNGIYRNNLDKVPSFFLCYTLVTIFTLKTFKITDIIFHRPKSNLFKVWPGSQMTQNRLWRSKVESIPRHTSLQPPEGSLW